MAVGAESAVVLRLSLISSGHGRTKEIVPWMYSRFLDFMWKIAEQTYAEPRHSSHDDITAKMGERVAPLLPVGGMILDVGSGSGPALEWFAEHGFKPVGIDLNADNIAACKALGFEVLRCDQNNLPEDWSETFDCVWARHVLEHSIAPLWTLHEFKRVLKPGGILYVEVPSPNTSSIHEQNVNHYSVFGDRMWQYLFLKAGFECVESMDACFATAIGKDRYAMFICRKP